MEFEQKLKDYVRESLPKKNDYTFIQQDEFEQLIDALVGLECAYIESVTPKDGGDINYDDDDAYDYVYGGICKKFGKYKMYCMRMVEDYFDLSEEFLTENGEIDWV